MTKRNAPWECACCPDDLSAAAESPAKFEARPLPGHGVKVPFRRFSPIAVRPREGPLTERAADAQPRRLEPVFMPPFGRWCSGGRYRAKTTQRSRQGQPASGRCDPLAGDRHSVRELIGEWIVYPFGTRMRAKHTGRPGGAAPVSAIAAAPLAPRPRDNNREKRPHSPRSIAAEISDCCGQYHASFRQYHVSLSTGR